jgi:hypothetical protein
MDITRNLKIESYLNQTLIAEVNYYSEKGLEMTEIIKSVSRHVSKVEFCRSDTDGTIELYLNDYDQSTIDDVLLDVDFVLTEMLNEKNK